MARKPHVPQPWIREAIIRDRHRFYASLAYASDLYATQHGNPNRAAEHAAAAAAVTSQLTQGEVYIAAAELWQALHHAGAADLAAQVSQLDRQHSRPGRPAWFRVDANDELHLDLEHAQA